MTNEEKRKIKAIINEHKKFLKEMAKVKNDEIASLQEMIDKNVTISSGIQQFGLFPYNARKFSIEARNELVSKYCADFNEKLYENSNKTADVHERTAEEILEDNGYLNDEYSNIVLLKNESYDSALIGVSDDNRAIYSFDKMVEWYMKKNGCTVEEAVEWIEFNTIRALPYMGANAPIIVHEFSI